MRLTVYPNELPSLVKLDEVNPALKARLSTKISEYMNRAEQIKKYHLRPNLRQIEFLSRYLERMQLPSAAPQPGDGGVRFVLEECVMVITSGTAEMMRPSDSEDDGKGQGDQQQGKSNPEMDKMKKALEGSSYVVAIIIVKFSKCRSYHHREAQCSLE